MHNSEKLLRVWKKNNKMEYPNNIKKIREQRGWSISEVLRRLVRRDINISEPTYSKIERGERDLFIKELDAIADVLRVDKEEIIKS